MCRSINKKKIILSILLLLILIVIIEVVPYFMAETPEYTLRKNFHAINSNNLEELNKVTIYDYEHIPSSEDHRQYLIYSTKVKLSENELEMELNLINKFNLSLLNDLSVNDIVKYKVIVYDSSTILPKSQEEIVLIKNKYNKDKNKWLLIP